MTASFRVIDYTRCIIMKNNWLMFWRPSQREFQVQWSEDSDNFEVKNQINKIEVWWCHQYCYNSAMACKMWIGWWSCNCNPTRYCRHSTHDGSFTVIWDYSGAWCVCPEEIQEASRASNDMCDLRGIDQAHWREQKSGQIKLYTKLVQQKWL